MKMKKINSYIGFARKSGNLIMGMNTCEIYMKKKKVKLLIITEDMAENTREKLIKSAEKSGTDYRVYGSSDEISQIVGRLGRGIFGIIDKHFAEIITKEIDKENQ